MENQPQIDVILETIRKEHRRTQLVFGIGIVILALVLMVIAPMSIRTTVRDSGMDDGPYEQNSYTGPEHQAAPAAMTGSTSVTVTP
jgi:hypothetical protein